MGLDRKKEIYDICVEYGMSCILGVVGMRTLKRRYD